MKRNIINLPFNATVADYEECCEKIRQEASQNDSVVSVYVLGGKWVPGISDIDIVVVYKDTSKPMRSPWEVSEIARRIFSHRYLSFSQNDFQQYFYTLYPKEVTNLRLLSGKELAMTDPSVLCSSGEYRAMLTVAIIDILVNKLLLPPLFGINSDLDIRKTLGTLHSISYTETLLSKIMDVPISETQTTGVDALRDGWFTRSIDDNLKLIDYEIIEARKRVLAIVGSIKDHLLHYGYSGSGGIFRNKMFNINFDLKWDQQVFFDTYRVKIFQIPFIKSRPRRIFYFRLPAEIFTIICDYGLFQRQWASLMRESLQPSLPNDKHNSFPGLRLRADAIGTVFEHTLETEDFYRAPFTYGFSSFDVRKKLKSKLFTSLISR